MPHFLVWPAYAFDPSDGVHGCYPRWLIQIEKTVDRRGLWGVGFYHGKYVLGGARLAFCLELGFDLAVLLDLIHNLIQMIGLFKGVVYLEAKKRYILHGQSVP